MEEPYVITHIRNLAVRDLETFADPGVLERAKRIPLENITLLQTKEYELHAQVVGTRPYLVRIDVDPVHTFPLCTCPVWHDFCKHVIAVMLHIDELAPGRDPLVDKALSTMTAADLVELIDALRFELPQAEPLLSRLARPVWFDPDYPGGVQRCIVAVMAARKSRTAVGWESALKVLRCETHPDRDLGDHELRRTVAVIQQAIGFIAREEGAMLGDASYTTLINEFLKLHDDVFSESDAPVEVLAELLVERYCSWVLPDPDLEDYRGFLEDEGLDAVLAAAAARGTTGVFKEQFANIAIDVELLRGNVEEAALLAGTLPVQDKLFEYFASAGRSDTCVDLLRRALDADDPTQLSAGLVQRSLTTYLEPAEARAVLCQWFLARPSVATFTPYLEAPGQTYSEVTATLAMVEDPDPTLMLMAATGFNRYEEGLLVIEHESVASFAATDWAVGVELPRDPVTAVRRLFAYSRLWLGAAADLGHEHPMATAAHVALQVAQLRDKLVHLEDRQLAADGLTQWALQLAKFKEEYRQWPYVASALAQHQL